MGYYQDQILPRLIDFALSREQFSEIRSRVANSLEGDVVEIGFGSGLNVPYYPNSIHKLQAVDPAILGRKLASKRVKNTPVNIEYIGLDGQKLPLESESVDHILITWTMCTIPDIEIALKEMYRVLRKGGQLHFVEHGRSPDPKVARWQDLLNPLQKKIGGGCHLNRPIDNLISKAGFNIVQLDNFYMKAPKPIGYTFEGIATK